MKKTTSKASESGSDAIVSVAAGGNIYSAKDPSDAVYVVEDGQVELLRDDVRLALLAKGEVFGEGAAYQDAPRDHAARAVGACRVLRLPKDVVDYLIEKKPEATRLLLARLVQRLARAEEDLRLASPRAASAVSAPVAAPRLARPRFLHVASGKEVPVPEKADSLVGRADPDSGYMPDVDLTDFDKERSLSRRHARVTRQATEFVINEEPRVRNGTFINGKRLKSGVAAKIQDGDEVAFGLIKTIFHAD
ncbi:MAG: cyclic nucleotide-binding domain-containing protein [Vicinamibacteria bacterium]|jgi:hypothetical protein|nr:cyclic nucleotide-binding domain-containing protein [Vicinamibacteria bacterium]